MMPRQAPPMTSSGKCTPYTKRAMPTVVASAYATTRAQRGSTGISAVATANATAA
jgi:hypothetical protein